MTNKTKVDGSVRMGMSLQKNDKPSNSMKIWTMIEINKWIDNIKATYPNKFKSDFRMKTKFILLSDHEKEIENWNIHYNNQQNIIDEKNKRIEELKQEIFNITFTAQQQLKEREEELKNWKIESGCDNLNIFKDDMKHYDNLQQQLKAEQENNWKNNKLINDIQKVLKDSKEGYADRIVDIKNLIQQARARK